MKTGTAAVAILGVLLGLSVAGERILLLPLGNASHFHEFHGLGRVLLHRGHAVHVVLGEQDQTIPSRASQSGYRVHVFNTNSRVSTKPAEATKLDLKHMPFTQTSLNEVIESYCEDLLNDDRLFDELDRLRFDAVVVDSMPLAHCFAILAHKLGNKNVVSLGTPINIWRARLPFVPALMEPSVLLTSYFGWADLEWQLEDESIAKRCLNSISQLLLTWKTFPIENLGLLLRHSNFNTYDELYSNTIALHLTNRDHILDVNIYPETTNVKFIGGIANLPPKQLTGTVLEWADGAEEGLVLCAFGAMFKALVLTAFSSLPHVRFLFLVSTTESAVAYNRTLSNILVVSNSDVSQNDVLAHRNVRLAIMHSENNEQYEALQHAVPMIALHDDEQLAIAKRVVKRGFGLRLHVHKFTVEQLLGAVSQVLANDTFKTRVANAAAMHRALPNPGQTAADYVQLLIQVGPEAFKPAYSYELNLLQFYNWDANLLVCALIYAWLAVLYKCVLCLKHVYL